MSISTISPSARGGQGGVFCLLIFYKLQINNVLQLVLSKNDATKRLLFKFIFYHLPLVSHPVKLHRLRKLIYVEELTFFDQKARFCKEMENAEFDGLIMCS